MKTLLVALSLGLSILSFAQDKPTKFQVFSSPVNADGSEITSKEAVLNSTFSLYTYAIEMASLENITKFHLSLGTDEANASSIGSWVIPFDTEYTDNGVSLYTRDNVVYINVGHFSNGTIYGTVKVEYVDGSTSANAIYTK